MGTAFARKSPIIDDIHLIQYLCFTTELPAHGPLAHPAVLRRVSHSPYLSNPSPKPRTCGSPDHFGGVISNVPASHFNELANPSCPIWYLHVHRRHICCCRDPGTDKLQVQVPIKGLGVAAMSSSVDQARRVPHLLIDSNGDVRLAQLPGNPSE